MGLMETASGTTTGGRSTRGSASCPGEAATILCFCDSVLWLFSCTLSQEKGNGYLLELQHQEKRIFLFAKSFKLNLNSITQHRSTFLFQVTM